MIGVFLVIISTFFAELSTSSAKESIQKHLESVSTRAFLTGLWGMFFLAVSVVAGATWHFSLASLPIFLSRVIIEIILTHITITAIVRADRSTFSFMRVMTIPLVLGIDVVLGQHFSTWQLIGIVTIMFALTILTARGSLTRKGLGFALASTVISAVTISLYKYDITHYNSVAAEQLLAHALILPYFFWHAVSKMKENPLRLLRSRRIMGEAAACGLGTLIGSFAYLFAPASVLVAVQRASSLGWSIIAGAAHFHERHIGEKAIFFGLTALGISLLAR